MTDIACNFIAGCCQIRIRRSVNSYPVRVAIEQVWIKQGSRVSQQMNNTYKFSLIAEKDFSQSIQVIIIQIQHTLIANVIL